MRKFFKVGPKRRLGNVPEMFTENFLFYQPEPEGEVPLQGAVAAACGVNRYRKTHAEGILSLYINIYLIKQHCCMVIQMFYYL